MVAVCIMHYGKPTLFTSIKDPGLAANQAWQELRIFILHLHYQRSTIVRYIHKHAAPAAQD